MRVWGLVARAFVLLVGRVGVCGGLFVNCIVVVCIFVSCGVLFLCWCLVFLGVRWMPGHQELMKDVAACDMPRGVGERVLIRGCPNGETWPGLCLVTKPAELV